VLVLHGIPEAKKQQPNFDSAYIVLLIGPKHTAPPKLRQEVNLLQNGQP